MECGALHMNHAALHMGFFAFHMDERVIHMNLRTPPVVWEPVRMERRTLCLGRRALRARWDSLPTARRALR